MKNVRSPHVTWATGTLRLLGCAAAILSVARPTMAAGPQVPASTSVQVATAWSRDDAAHLLRRAGFGGTPEQIDALHALGREAAVEHLLTGKLPEGAQLVFAKADLKAYVPVPVTEQNPEKQREQMRDLSAQAQKAGKDSDAARKLDATRRSLQQQQQRNERQEIDHLRLWWVERMLRTDRPLEEKMTLFWHNLFTSGYREVKSSKMLVEQNALFHDQALGNYRKLTQSIVHDGAMLRYLNNDQNVKGKPNENLARELMELFTLGEGSGYTEQDIKEVARALTGLAPGGRIGPMGGRGYGGPVAMRPFMHDDGEKTIFGKTGKFGPDDVIELLFAKPEPSRYLAKRLWTAFVSADPSDADLAPVVKAIQDSNYEVTPALRLIFNSPAFYGEPARFAMIKSPAEVAVGTMRLLGRDAPTEPQVVFVMRQMVAMDQELLQPPNVRGWVGGDNWITAATLFTRYNTATMMVIGGAAGQQRRQFGGGQPTPEQMKTMMEQRAARTGGGPTTRPAGAAGPGVAAGDGNADPQMAERRRMFAERMKGIDDPKMREQMMQQYAGRLGGAGQQLAPVDADKLFTKLAASPSREQIVDAALGRFLQRPLHPDKRQALIDVLGDEPIKIGTPDSDNRIRQMISLVFSTPEYQVE